MPNNSNNLDTISEHVISSNNSMSVFQLISKGDGISKLVLFVLFLSSVISIAIILEKFFRNRKLKKKLHQFEDLFWSGKLIEDLYQQIRQNIDNPLSAIFIGGMNEFKKLENSQMDNTAKCSIVFQTMQLIKNRELESLEKNLTFLAIVGAYAPFIGLFGTVWGIIHSFQAIAISKNTSLVTVAPGMAESLIATALGIFVALPAAISYNAFIANLNKTSNQFDDFVIEVNTILVRALH